jgi:hypothetical protein
MSDVLVIERTTACSVDAAGTEHPTGHLVVEDIRVTALPICSPLLERGTR